MRILLLEDASDVADAIIASFARRGDAMDHATTVAEAKDSIAVQDYDVAILDIDMPQMTGLEAARVLSGKELPTRIILLTMHEDEALFNEAVDLGVVGYVLKENAVDDVVKAIRIVAEGGTFISPSVADFLFRRSRRTRELHKEKPGLENLTPAEKRILRRAWRT